MFNVGGAELFIILLLALVVLGPDKLPGAMRTVGQWAGEMRKMANGFQAEMNKAIKDPLDTKGAEGSSTAKAGDVQPKTSNGSSSNGSSSNGSNSNGSSSNGPSGDPATGDETTSTAADEGSAGSSGSSA
jgi:sec-independent protein translocase protein TatB